MNQLLANIPFTCACGVEVMLTKLQGRTERCADCREEHEENKRLMNSENKRAAFSKGPRCSCGCPRPRGEGRTFLSDYCYKNGGETDYSLPLGWDLEPVALSDQPLLTGVEATF